MSLAEVTRNCFQSGISASKWLGLCKLLISKEPTMHSPDIVESNLSNSVLVLYRSYPGDPGLQEYLKHAIQDGSISVATFVSTLLQAARSPELHTPATLDTLCRVALDAHYSSGLPPLGSVVPYSESALAILSTVQDALALLRIAHSLPISHFHQLMTSASELVILLLSCIPDVSQVSTTQAMVYYADVNDLLNNFRLTPDVRQVLENFAISLSYVIGDDAKAAREAQMMHTIQLTLGKGEIAGQNSETDIITLSLVLHHLLYYRAHEFGVGSSADAVALLVGTFRWSSWTPIVFYTQLLLSAFTCLSQSSTTAFLWKAFIVGRLPPLLLTFENIVKADSTINADWRNAIQTSVATVLRRTDIIVPCEHLLSRIGAVNALPDEDTSRPLSREFLQHLIKSELIDISFAVQMDPAISNDVSPRVLLAESQAAGVDLAVYLESKLSPDLSLDDTRAWIERIWRDVGAHSAFSTAVLKLFSSLVGTLDEERLSHLCKILYVYDVALDIVSLHIRISDLIFHALNFLERYDCETVGDPQTAFSHLGDVVLFVQYTLARFQFERKVFTMENRSVSSAFLGSTDLIHSIDSLSGEEATCFTAWFKALFDSSSEGIEDTILRSTQPKMLLRISGTLFSQAIKASSMQKIDGDVLNNGVSYFTGPLLNWTLVGVVKALVREVQQKGFNAPTHTEILHTLLSHSCPRPVLALCSPHISLLLGRASKGMPFGTTSDIDAIRRTVADAAGTNNDSNESEPINYQISEGYIRQTIQDAFTLARSQKAPSLDVEKCLKTVSPSRFLQFLWSELVVSASLGETEACKRIATFTLTMPRSSNVPPLLPIFLHSVLPTLIATVDRQQPTEQTMNVELLATVISSVLTGALHLEWAMRSVSGDNRSVLGQPSTGMARRLAANLRAKNHNSVSGMIARRLASSQSFVANFPMFMGELGI